MSQERYSDEYVIVYTNGRTVQGHRVILSTSKVDILIRAKVQGAFSTYRMLYLTAGTITKSSSASVCLCGVYVSPPDENVDDTDEDMFPSGFDWLFILGGLVSGLVVGFVMGDIFTDRHPWLIQGIVQRSGRTQNKPRMQKSSEVAARDLAKTTQKTAEGASLDGGGYRYGQVSGSRKNRELEGHGTLEGEKVQSNCSSFCRRIYSRCCSAAEAQALKDTQVKPHN
ncbi:hypothetical protein AgCh_030119 [Apium graveolens]